MIYRVVNRITAAAVFVISLFQFLVTAQPSVPFWDPGELTAAAFMLQVPHPPGGPLFLLVARVFSMLPIPGNLGFRVNLVSVVASALAVLFTYLIAVRLINNTRKGSPTTRWEAIATFGAAAIGALTFSFSDTFWFNGVESNYFAASTFLFSVITWLMLVWYEHADEEGSGRYLILIGYLVGLSAGVHLMSVPAIVAVGMVIGFKRFVEDDGICITSVKIFIGHVALIILVTLLMWSSLTAATPPSAEDAKAYDMRYLMIVGVISALYMAVFWRRVFNKSSFYLPLALGAIILLFAYPGVVKLVPKLLHALSENSTSAGMVILLVILGLFGYVAYWLAKRRVGLLERAAVAMIAAILGFTTYTTILIRSNQDPPMNENQPKTLDGLLTYLNREQYGDFPIFKRRWSPEGRHRYTWTNYKSDLDFFLTYQMDHMYNRYVEWNFIGRASYDQDAGVNWKDYFGIPFFLALAGLYFHFRKSWKVASVMLVLFVIMGYLIAFYQNQQDMQPRDRDYFYCGSYLIITLWIALGVRGIIDLIGENLKRKELVNGTTVGVLIITAMLVPGRMLQINYPTHDRSKNWVPWDFAYNILQSCEPNAVLFTNGDNDTFPLWYLQDVEKIRRDVRIVNLSLVNTSWYIHQLKDKEPYGTPRVKITFPDADIDKLGGPIPWQTQVRKIPVPTDVIREFGVTDTAVLSKGYLTYTFQNTAAYGNVKAIRTQDLMVMEIVERNVWDRPIYFASTCSEDTKIGLNDYLKLEGLASRLVPQRRPQTSTMDYIDEKILHAELFDDSANFSMTYRPGLKFRGLDDPKVFLDENMSMMTRNYRSTFVRLALYYIYVQRTPALAEATLDRMEKVMPRSVNIMDFRMLFDVANLYQAAGNNDKFREVASEAEKAALESISKNPTDYSSAYNPYRILAEIYDRTAQYGKAADLLEGLLKVFPKNPQLLGEIQRYRNLAAGSDTALVPKP